MKGCLFFSQGRLLTQNGILSFLVTRTKCKPRNKIVTLNWKSQFNFPPFYIFMLVAVAAIITLTDGSYDRRARNLNFEKICQQSALRKKADNRFSQHSGWGGTRKCNNYSNAKDDLYDINTCLNGKLEITHFCWHFPDDNYFLITFYGLH